MPGTSKGSKLKIAVASASNWIRVRDSTVKADSPGPIPSVVERFRPRADRPEPLTGPAAEAARYTVLLIPPESTDPLGHDRDDPGLKLYCDDEYDCDLSSLYEATQLIEEQCKAPVTLVEHRSDLTYWTVHLRTEATHP